MFAADSTAPLLFSFTCGTYIDNQAHIVLTWTDPPGNQASFMQLVNDLDLVVVTPSAQVHFFFRLHFLTFQDDTGNYSAESHVFADIRQHDGLSRHSKQR
jgi:hypothetical protein